MGDPYYPFTGKKGKSWGEFDLQSIAERVAGISPALEEAARKMVEVCKAENLDLEEAKEVLEAFFPTAGSSERTRR